MNNKRVKLNYKKKNKCKQKKMREKENIIQCKQMLL